MSTTVLMRETGRHLCSLIQYFYLFEYHSCMLDTSSLSGESDDDFFPSTEQIRQRCLRLEREEYLQVTTTITTKLTMPLSFYYDILYRIYARSSHAMNLVRKRSVCWPILRKEQHQVLHLAIIL